ncbi:MAG: hypothetical protein F6K30_18020 [Cyanothece sp. SIO2G6]|nr:hypothetical protein [Cyanothece sp. SIO2G6]
MYVYCSAQVKTDAKRHGVWDRIDQLITRIEQSGPTAYTLFFEPRYPCWIRKIDNFRLIAVAPQTFRNHIPVLYLAAILRRGDSKYDPEFLNDPTQWAKRNFSRSKVSS